MRKVASILSGLVLAAAAFTLAADLDVSGKWKITSKSQRGERTFDATMKQEGEKLTVTQKDREGNDVKAEGTVKAGEITWTMKRTTPMGEMVITYKGKVDGKTMSGTTTSAGWAPASGRRRRPSSPRHPRQAEARRLDLQVGVLPDRVELPLGRRRLGRPSSAAQRAREAEERPAVAGQFSRSARKTASASASGPPAAAPRRACGAPAGSSRAARRSAGVLELDGLAQRGDALRRARPRGRRSRRRMHAARRRPAGRRPVLLPNVASRGTRVRAPSANAACSLARPRARPWRRRRRRARSGAARARSAVTRGARGCGEHLVPAAEAHQHLERHRHVAVGERRSRFKNSGGMSRDHRADRCIASALLADHHRGEREHVVVVRHVEAVEALLAASAPVAASASIAFALAVTACSQRPRRTSMCDGMCTRCPRPGCRSRSASAAASARSGCGDASTAWM